MVYFVWTNQQVLLFSVVKAVFSVLLKRSPFSDNWVLDSSPLVIACGWN